MLLLKFTWIFLKAPSRKHFFSIFTCRALVRNRTLMISCLCNVLFTGLQHDTTLDSPSALDREIFLKKTCIHTNMTWARFPSLVELRLRAFGAQPPSENKKWYLSSRLLAEKNTMVAQFSLYFDKEKYSKRKNSRNNCIFLPLLTSILLQVKKVII